MTRRVAIIGAGQSGMQLALGLLAGGCEVTVYSDRTAQEIHDGPVMSSQCMFETALQTERALGLDHWTDACPVVEDVGMAVRSPEGARAIAWSARAVDRFDRRDFRRALGQFSTGVTVITTRALDDRRVGMTANSFASVSLDPPLVVEGYERFDGEPLVFHSGYYQVTTRHPECVQ